MITGEATGPHPHNPSRPLRSQHHSVHRKRRKGLTRMGGRLLGLPASDDYKPGSYISSISCDAHDFSSPIGVRRKVRGLKTPKIWSAALWPAALWPAAAKPLFTQKHLTVWHLLGARPQMIGGRAGPCPTPRSPIPKVEIHKFAAGRVGRGLVRPRSRLIHVPGVEIHGL